MGTYNIKNGKKEFMSIVSIPKNGAVESILKLNPFPFLESILYIAKHVDKC